MSLPVMRSHPLEAGGLLPRRRLLQAAAGLAAVAVSVGAQAAPATLPLSESLQDELAAALKKGSPLLVMVSLDGCPFCKVARRNYLSPMREQDGLHVVQIDMRSAKPVRDFNGRVLTHDELVRRWDITLAPTVLFFGRGGAEVAERLVGGYIPDFYGAYLEERLLQARAAVRA